MKNIHFLHRSDIRVKNINIHQISQVFSDKIKAVWEIRQWMSMACSNGKRDVLDYTTEWRIHIIDI